MAAPSSPTGRCEQFARTRGIFVLDRHRSANRAGPCDVTSKFYEIGMRDISVGHIDSKGVTGIADSPLRHEDEVPRAVVGRAPVCCRCKCNEAACCHDQKRTLCHDSSLIWLGRVFGRSSSGRHSPGPARSPIKHMGLSRGERLSAMTPCLATHPAGRRSPYSVLCCIED